MSGVTKHSKNTLRVLVKRTDYKHIYIYIWLFKKGRATLRHIGTPVCGVSDDPMGVVFTVVGTTETLQGFGL